jgi:hypothetical protein
MCIHTNKRKEVKTMKYETPELTALTPAISTIQMGTSKPGHTSLDGTDKEEVTAYADWED